MSLISSSNLNSKNNNYNSIFRNTNKIVNITNVVTNIVTKNVTEKIENEYLLYDNLYDDVGNDIKNILNAFVTGSDELTKLINYENYSNLADNLHSHLNENNKTLEDFRKILIDAVEGAKHCSNKMLEQEYTYNKLLDAYNSVVGNNTKKTMLLEVETPMTMTAKVKPEILEYIRLGHKIVDEDGKIIPIDMDILAVIRSKLDII